MARPILLTPEVEATIVRFVRSGAPLEVAAQASGISPTTFWSWMAAGEGRPSKVQPSEMLSAFSEKVRRAEAETHALVIGTIRTAAVTQGNWQAALAYARMRWSHFYAERVEVGSPDPDPLGSEIGDHERLLLRKAIDEYLAAHPEEAEIPETETVG